MIISVRTPLRVSLFGGGTDYRSYFSRNPGSVLGFAIDKYIYVTALTLNTIVDYRFRVSYSKVEHVQEAADIKHPVVRCLLRHYDWDTPADISIQSDLPAALGLGSSSSFTVGMVHLMSELARIPRTRMELAREAIHTEQVLLQENVGIQDPLHATFGGMNRFDFQGDDFRIMPINISGRDLEVFTDSMVLVYTGIKRRATEIAQEQIERTNMKVLDRELHDMLALVDEAQATIEDKRNREAMVETIGRLLAETWALKKRLSDRITNRHIDELYEFCLKQGAFGGKLCGAGGGGFLLMIVPPECRARFEDAVGPSRCMPFRVDVQGTVILQKSHAA